MRDTMTTDAQREADALYAIELKMLDESIGSSICVVGADSIYTDYESIAFNTKTRTIEPLKNRPESQNGFYVVDIHPGLSNDELNKLIDSVIPDFHKMIRLFDHFGYCSDNDVSDKCYGCRPAGEPVWPPEAEIAPASPELLALITIDTTSAVLGLVVALLSTLCDLYRDILQSVRSTNYCLGTVEIQSSA